MKIVEFMTPGLVTEAARSGYYLVDIQYMIFKHALGYQNH